MNAIYKQKELLLVLHSNFFSKQMKESCYAASDGWFSQKEQLKTACMNGLSSEILPECFDKTFDKSVPLWEINDANTFIDLVFCKDTQSNEKQFSVNPYIFMQVQDFN